MNKRTEVKLTSWQRKRLQQIRDKPPNPRMGKRAVCLLLSAEAVPSKLIAKVTGPIQGWNHRHPTALARTRDGLLEGASTSRKTTKGKRRISKTVKKGDKSRAAYLRLYLYRLEHCQTEYPPAKDYRNQDMQRLATTTGACRRFCLSSAQAYPQGQTQRASVSQGSEEAQTAQKGALAPNADYELWYLDESEFHLHPHLRRMWMPKGRQKRVRSPGVNRKQTVFGAFYYGRGLFYYHIQPRKTAWGVQMLP